MNLRFKAQTEKTPSVFLYVDAEKVFDRIEWRYIHYVVKEYWVGNIFVSWLWLLYEDQTVIIVHEGVCSEKN